MTAYTGTKTNTAKPWKLLTRLFWLLRVYREVQSTGMLLSATFYNISAISRRSILLEYLE